MTLNSDYDYNDVSTTVTWGGAVQLQVDESNLNHDATADFSGVFNVQPGADGLGSQSYSLNVQNANSGLIDTATGEQIQLSMNGSTLEGHTATTGQLVFSLTVDSSGKVTLDHRMLHLSMTESLLIVSLHIKKLCYCSSTGLSAIGATVWCERTGQVTWHHVM